MVDLGFNCSPCKWSFRRDAFPPGWGVAAAGGGKNLPGKTSGVRPFGRARAAEDSTDRDRLNAFNFFFFPSCNLI